MSLRGVHVLFISLSALLAAGIAVWAMGEYRAGGTLVYAAGAAAAIGASGALVAYGVSFLRRSRTWPRANRRL